MYLFYDSWSGTYAIFSTEEKAMQFRKAWKHYTVDKDWNMEEGEDWLIEKIPNLDMPIEEWFKAFEGRD